MCEFHLMFCSKCGIFHKSAYIVQILFILNTCHISSKLHYKWSPLEKLGILIATMITRCFVNIVFKLFLCHRCYEITNEMKCMNNVVGPFMTDTFLSEKKTLVFFPHYPVSPKSAKDTHLIFYRNMPHLCLGLGICASRF